VRAYMRSVVRAIAQCHAKDEPHGAVSTSKFMLLSEDRGSTVKATGFGRLAAGQANAGAPCSVDVVWRCCRVLSKCCTVWVTNNAGPTRPVGRWLLTPP
jgi:hypothetical protein